MTIHDLKNGDHFLFKGDELSNRLCRYFIFCRMELLISRDGIMQFAVHCIIKHADGKTSLWCNASWNMTTTNVQLLP